MNAPLAVRGLAAVVLCVLAVSTIMDLLLPEDDAEAPSDVVVGEVVPA